ncbi:hypothetical protein XENOCAPTIV_010549, partial [Xenoophorus captivus]
LKAELHLDWLKGTKGGVKRVLFLDTQQPQHSGLLRLGQTRPRACLSYMIYLKEEDEFRDKLTPIALTLNYSLALPSPDQTLPPVLNEYSSTFLQEHVGEQSVEMHNRRLYFLLYVPSSILDDD